MRLIEGQITEPVTLDEVKDAPGYAPSDHTDDDFLRRNITAMRELFEKASGTLVVNRSMTIYTECTRIPLPAPVTGISSVTALVDGQEIEVDDYHVWDCYTQPVLTLVAPRGASEITVSFHAGLEETPAVVKEAIVDLVKARYERVALEPVLADIRTSCYAYWRESI